MLCLNYTELVFPASRHLRWKIRREACQVGSLQQCCPVQGSLWQVSSGAPAFTHRLLPTTLGPPHTPVTHDIRLGRKRRVGLSRQGQGINPGYEFTTPVHSANSLPFLQPLHLGFFHPPLPPWLGSPALPGHHAPFPSSSSFIKQQK